MLLHSKSNEKGCSFLAYCRNRFSSHNRSSLVLISVMRICQRREALRQAYKEWVKTFPVSGGSCCFKMHTYVHPVTFVIKPKDDEDVCARELAWRNYVRIRDNNSLFPFNRNLGTDERILGDDDE
jgi:hypothetical protein